LFAGEEHGLVGDEGSEGLEVTIRHRPRKGDLARLDCGHARLGRRLVRADRDRSKQGQR